MSSYRNAFSRAFAADKLKKEIPASDGIFQFFNPWMDLCFCKVKNKLLSQKKEQLEKEIVSLASDNSQKVKGFLQKKLQPLISTVERLNSLSDTDLNSLIKEMDVLLQQKSGK